MDLQLERLAWEVDELSRFYALLGEPQLHLSVYPLWDVSDVLRHLVWWHESFASIAAAADEGGEGVVPRGRWLRSMPARWPSSGRSAPACASVG